MIKWFNARSKYLILTIFMCYCQNVRSVGLGNHASANPSSHSQVLLLKVDWKVARSYSFI